MVSEPNAPNVENGSGLNGGATSNPLKSEVPTPEEDPFELLLKPMLAKDTAQCTAWKDEVQNTLIFAGLFSAVVTAFIIESYQQLQPDSNDVIVGLLAHIADRLDNAPNKSESVSSIITSTSFSPSHTNTNINIFWFISLVLSLTAALIGIVALQWLREHQRYDTTLKPKQILAILNARLHAFEQWYVPQIFAGLPLLLQGALVLFFAGIIEFLFALRLEVAVPVTLIICVPLIFLIATTMLPLLQVCILQDPFRLSINNNVPSPCPYKSPQSHIVRRFGVGSRIVFTSLASMIARAYILVIKISCLVQELVGHRPPVFHSQRPDLQLRLRDKFPQRICEIRDAQAGDWVSIDTAWLKVRTTYALSLQMVHRADNDLINPRTADLYKRLLPEVYDCTSYFHKILRQKWANADLFIALHTCIEALCTEAMDNFHSVGITRDQQGNTDQSSLTDLCFAFGRFACYDLDAKNVSITAAFIEDVISHESPDKSETTVKTLPTAFMTSWIFAISKHLPHIDTATHVRQRQLTAQLIMKRLEIGAERLFLMNGDEAWLPTDVLNEIQHFSREHSLHRAAQKHFSAFLQECSMMQPGSRLLIRHIPARKAYTNILAYMRAILSVTVLIGGIEDTFARITELCNSEGSQNLIREKPFLLIAACFYFDVAGDRNGSKPLLAIILESCGTKVEGGFGWSIADKTFGWTGLDDAIGAIYDHHKSSHQLSVIMASAHDQANNSIVPPVNLRGHDGNV